MMPLQAILAQLEQSILGKPLPLRLALASVLAKGHLLIQDLPGMGKTTLAHALASALGLDFRRQQFTADMIPADVLGGNIFDPQAGQLRFHPGAVFTQVLLADELNRASPKAQSALLEAMEEGQVSLEGVSYPLPQPFFVIATQNPVTQLGTFPLPESQLDRFLLSISLGYPSAEAERALLSQGQRHGRQAPASACIDAQQLQAWQAEVAKIRVRDPVLDYIQALLLASRAPERFALGLSPRAGQGLLRASQAWAFLEQRAFVVPEDVQQVFVALAGHRLVGQGQEPGIWLAEQLLEQVDVPL